MPLLQTKPRISVDTSKGFIKYAHRKATELLRIPGASMNKIDTKDKTINNPFFAILPEIKKRTSTLFKEYYQALQPLRNVRENKDYTLEAYIEFKIFADSMLIGKFKGVEQPANKDWMYNSNEIYNGYDSSTVFKLNSSFPKGAIVITKSIEGSIGKDAFKILFNDDIDVKIIYLNHVAIWATQGKNKPNYLIPLETLDQHNISSLLIMIAYSEIFQSPN